MVMKQFYIKIIIPTILAILLFIMTIFFVIIPQYRESIMNGKREQIKELTNSALSILAKYENDEKEGIISRNEAQKTAISRIQYLRYGDENKDYFWITDVVPVMVVHPFRPDLNGTNLESFTDPHGKKMFVEFVNTVKLSGDGYVGYMWQWKDDSTHIVPKLSYVKIFEPWNWVVGTGIYIEDVNHEISALTRRLTGISTGIAILIAFLLTYIFKQSLETERKRVKAENDLHISREKYRALVEATTEGLLMLSNGNIIFSNSVFSKMIGYPTDELNQIPFNHLLSKRNNNDTVDALSGEKINDGTYEVNIASKNEGVIDTLIAVSTSDFYGKEVNILIVKNTSENNPLQLTNIEYQKLITTLNVGFFKARIGDKGKFIFANESVVRILGFKDFDSIKDCSLLNLIAEKNKRDELVSLLSTDGFVKNKIISIVANDKAFKIINLSMVVIHSNSNTEFVCDAIIEDITGRETEKAETDSLITELKAGDILFENPVSDYMQPIIAIDAEQAIEYAIDRMERENSSHLLLTNTSRQYIGIVTKSDIQQRVVALGLHLENPSYMIMSSPLIMVTSDMPIIDALILCEKKNIGHLLLKDHQHSVVGIFSVETVLNNLYFNRSFFLKSISECKTVEELKVHYKRMLFLIKPLLKSGVDVPFITRITTLVSNAITTRLIDLAILDLGVPDIKFAFICMGSEGRKEETLFTDQDNAILFENLPKAREEEVKNYFLKLGEIVCNGLNEIGYTFCVGKIMANNPQWCNSIKTWEDQYLRWISTPEPQHLIDANIFFDLRFVYGNPELVDQLKATIKYGFEQYPSFFYMLAQNASSIKLPQISGSGILSEKSSDSVDLKNAIIPIVMFARVYSLKNDIWITNTVERLEALRQINVITHSTIDEMLFAYNFLMKLRFKLHVYQIEQNRNLTNSFQVKKLIDTEYHVLRKILSAIADSQSRIKQDFRIIT
jgi:signal-transduction protein with cAMP-binding, CBS, and nucleotidyltransferase domain/PAS domain-containing protein